MLWVLLDIAVGMLAVLFLAGCVVSLWRHVKTLMKSAGDASTKLSAAMPAPVQSRP